MSTHDTPQQAIEDYLEALLCDDGSQDVPASALWRDASEAASVQSARPSFEPDQSMQAQSLVASMAEFKKNTARPLAEAAADDLPQVILPELNLTAEAHQEEPEPAFVEPESPAVAKAVEEVAFEAPEPVLEAPVEKVEEIQPEPEPVQFKRSEDQLDEQPPVSPPGWKNGRPVWAQERFECLLFKVKGLTLAVPLVELGGIIKIEKQPTPIFGQPSWFLGMLRSNKSNVCMVDTAQWVLPPALINQHPEPYQLVIRIHNSQWGLSCNQVDRSISLQPDQVRWRTSLGKRPWLAGTVIEHMCALIDAAAFDRLLKEGHGELEPANLKSIANFED
ncbi:chemotaxis protein CheW [Marinospirillum sp.]|uniref:chemotaxis protein CheW n=1 Tax=Marinospirillum sp. TaxID=2183934 RepID=UPI003A89C943